MKLKFMMLIGNKKIIVNKINELENEIIKSYDKK